jgi:hypothetical protein
MSIALVQNYDPSTLDPTDKSIVCSQQSVDKTQIRGLKLNENGVLQATSNWFNSNTAEIDTVKNYYGYMDQVNYIIELYVENNIPPAPRGYPFNDVTFTAALKDDTLTSNDIAPMGATNVPQNGGTFGPGDQSQPSTFNVEYFYIEGNYFNQGPDNYNVDLYVNAGLEYSVAGVPGNAAAQFFDYTSFNTPNAQNNGSGFSLEVYFS